MFIIIGKSILALLAFIFVVFISWLVLVLITYIVGIIFSTIGLKNLGTNLKLIAKDSFLRFLNAFKLKEK
jgi:hypothetical protein